MRGRAPVTDRSGGRGVPPPAKPDAIGGQGGAGRRSFSRVAGVVLVAGALVGAWDGALAAAYGRLGLGGIGVVGLVALGAVGGAAAASPLGLVALVPAARRRGLAGWAVAGAALPLAGLAGVRGAELGGAGSVGLAVGVASALVAVAALVVGARVVARTPRWLGGAPTGALALGLVVAGGSVAAGVASPGRPRAASPERPAVLLVTVDGLRADVAQADHAADTPHLARLALEGAVTAGLVAASVDADGAIDAVLDARSPLDAPQGPSRGLVARFADAGWPTAAFVPRPMPGERMEGFAVVDDRGLWPVGLHQLWPVRALELAVGSSFAPARPARRVVGRAAAWLARQPGAAFAWVHLDDPLQPWTPPPPWDARGPDAEDGGRVPVGSAAPVHPAQRGALGPEPTVASMTARYGGEVAAVDAAIGELLASLDDARRGAVTLVVVVGVRGQHLTDAEPWFGPPEGPPTRAGAEVAAWLRLPGRVPVSALLPGPAETSDVGATVAALAGLAPEGPARPLLPAEGAAVRSLGRVGGRAGEAAVRAPGAWLALHPDGTVTAARPEESAAVWTPDRVAHALGILAAATGTSPVTPAGAVAAALAPAQIPVSGQVPTE